MSLLGDEYRLIGKAYFHTGNSGLTMTILDKGFGITSRWSVASHGLTEIGFEIDLSKKACHNLMWMAINAATYEKDYPDNILNAPSARLTFGDRQATNDMEDRVDLISPTGKIEIGYRCVPELELYIEGKSHGVPNLAARIETKRSGFISMAKLFHRASEAEYSPEMRNVYDVKKSSNLARLVNGEFPTTHKGIHPTVKDALVQFKKLLHVEQAMGS